MPKIILGDNPFFAVSHLDPTKSNEYLIDKERFSKAFDIVSDCRKIGIDDFMISCHEEASDFLTRAGFKKTFVPSLPNICLVVPNVHQINKNAAESGLFSTFKQLLKRFRFSRKGLISLLSGTPYFGNIKYIALHNVVSDLLIGLNSKMLFKIFHYTCKCLGVQSVIITFNPLKLLDMKVKCDVICTYYNSLGYNVCYSITELNERIEENDHLPKFWAMGISASGAVTSESWRNDDQLTRFDGLLIASTKKKRINTMVDDINASKYRGI
jgi:hypothetical protein